MHWNVPGVAEAARDLTEAEFHDVFSHVVHRRGWPILKFGRGKTVKRCLQIRGNELLWGSHKTDQASSTSVSLLDIVEVTFADFEDAPTDIDKDCMIAINIANRALCFPTSLLLTTPRRFRTQNRDVFGRRRSHPQNRLRASPRHWPPWLVEISRHSLLMAVI